MDDAMSRDPSEDEAFGTLLDQWSSGRLGSEGHEGVGLLWKEGGIAALLGELHRRAPRTMAALATRLADGAPPFAEDGTYIPRALFAEFVAAMALPPRERSVRLGALEIDEPTSELSAVLAAIDPPMATRFRRRIEAWVELAAGIEARASAATMDGNGAVQLGAAGVVGRERPLAPERHPLLARVVVHAKFGRGRVLGEDAGKLQIDFGPQGVRTVLARFVTPEGE